MNEEKRPLIGNPGWCKAMESLSAEQRRIVARWLREEAREFRANEGPNSPEYSALRYCADTIDQH